MKDRVKVAVPLRVDRSEFEPEVLVADIVYKYTNVYLAIDIMRTYGFVVVVLRTG